MREVRIAEEAGACYGVERALRLAHDAAKHADGSVHTLGPLIHNPLVIADLQSEGVTAVESPLHAAVGSTLLLRAHGVTPELEATAREHGLEVIDATCPFVKKVHTAAQRLIDQGYDVLVVGEKGHPEVEGTLGHALGSRVVGSAEDIQQMTFGRRVGLVVQTTLTHETLREVVGALVGRCEEVRLIDTICEATNKRQQAAKELASEADVMIVIGGRNSANTTHLADICKAQCARTHHIESAAEIEDSWLVGAELVGVTAGASTPAEHINEVVEKLEAL